jgi:hypothetical protein
MRFSAFSNTDAAFRDSKMNLPPQASYFCSHRIRTRTLRNVSVLYRLSFYQPNPKKWLHLPPIH